MHKVITPLAVFLIFASSINGQPRIQFGIEGGFSLANIREDGYAEGTLNNPGMVLGGFAILSSKLPTSWRIELLYSQKGYRLVNEMFGETSDGLGRVRIENTIVLGVDYLEMNLFYLLPVFKGGYLAFGVSMGQPVRSKSVSTASGEPEDLLSDYDREQIAAMNWEETHDPKDLNGVDIGILGEVGIQLGHWLVGVRYNYGMKRAYHRETPWKNHAVQTIVGIVL